MITTRIVNSNGKEIHIDDNGSPIVTSNTHPPSNPDITLLPYRDYFRNSNGSIEMNVNGSVNNVDFYIGSHSSLRSIKSIFVSIVDANSTLNQFGNIGILTNGIEFKWDSSDFGEVIIADSLKTNFDFISLSGGQPAYGAGINAFIASNVVSNEEAIISFVDFTSLFGFQYGIPLRPNTNDRLVFTIKDDLLAVTQFRIIAYGSEF